MRVFSLVLILATVLVSFDSPAVRARQDDDTDARGVFIKSRPKKATRVVRTAARPVARPIAVSPTAHGFAEPVGLGFSLFRVLDKARAVRVSPSATFHKGDDLRFVLEPSIDGFLYVFVTTGEKRPVMIYPDPRLERGDNFVYAHSVVEVPSRRNPAFDIFKIVGDPATERLLFVVSRDPLPGVPVSDELVKYCEKTACPWSPPDTSWEEIARQSTAERGISVRKDDGTRITAIEEDALTRDLVLGASDAQPTVIAVNGSVDTPILVHAVSIRHE